MLDRNLMKKVRSEIKDQILTNQPPNTNILDVLNYDNTNNLTFFSYCFNESLRMDPPVHFSSFLTFT